MDTDRPDSRNARFVRFTVTAGPGPLGAAFRQEWRAIEAPAGIPRMERVTVLDANRADFRHGVLGPHVSHNALLSQSPAVLQVNEVPVVGVSLKRVAMTMASAPRPTTLLPRTPTTGLPWEQVCFFCFSFSSFACLPLLALPHFCTTDILGRSLMMCRETLRAQEQH